MTSLRQTTGRDHAQTPRLWSIHDVSAFIGVPVATIYQWRYGQAYGEDLFRHTATALDGWRQR